jgi:septation ring formation regulator EzrA
MQEVHVSPENETYSSDPEDIELEKDDDTRINLIYIDVDIIRKEVKTYKSYLIYSTLLLIVSVVFAFLIVMRSTDQSVGDLNDKLNSMAVSIESINKNIELLTDQMNAILANLTKVGAA